MVAQPALESADVLAHQRLDVRVDDTRAHPFVLTVLWEDAGGPDGVDAVEVGLDGGREPLLVLGVRVRVQ
jgi:hypothetical protein